MSLTLIASLTLMAGRSSAQKADDLAVKAEAILIKNCAECHKKSVKLKKVKGDLDLWNPKDTGDAERKILVPGKPETSEMIRRLRPEEKTEQMPPKKALSDADYQVLKAWVKAGGKYPTGKIETRSTDDKPPAKKPPVKVSEEDKGALAEKARDLLSTYCHRCHGVEFNGRLDVMKRTVMIAERKGKKRPYVTPGNPDKSDLFLRFAEDMPPEEETLRPSAADREVIKQWIEAGAPDFSTTNVRKFVSTKEMILTMRNHLKNAVSEDRPYLKFFTMTHLHNDPTVTENLFRQSIAALSKVINSLSWRPDIVVPKAIDRENTIFVVDIRELDWDRSSTGVKLWRAILAAYPYGLRYDEDDTDDEFAQADKDLYRYAGNVLPYIRGDWFVTTAARPPLYHILLQLPNNAVPLEKDLNVDIYANFQSNKLVRAGFIKSGVSGQNRMLERHPAKFGAYWKSYDFKEHTGDKAVDRDLAARANIINYPLGPKFPGRRGNEFDKQAFIHDGGEAIFHLPNGLQGYFLVNGKDGRIDQGPEDVVSDNKKTSGTPAIVNGLSCMYCHRHGMIRFTDEIRESTSVGGAARVKVRRLFPEQKKMEELLRKDEARFMTALDQAIGPFLKVGKNKETPIEKLTGEPVGELARRYKLVALGVETVAAELGYEKVNEFETLLKISPELRDLGLGPLAKAGGSIKRFEWERIGATSLFQRVARRLKKGTPVNVLK
jgi:serine/threonine-protein kinase